MFFLEHSSSESFVLCLNRGISTSTGANLTQSAMLIKEVTVEFGLKQEELDKHQIFSSPKIFPKIKNYNGSIATLTTFSQSNYFHWLFDVIPKIHLLDKSGLKPDKIYVEVKSKFQIDTLQLIGYESEKIVNSSTSYLLSASQLFVPSLPDYNVGNMPAWSCNFLRQTFLSCATQGSEVSEKKHRRVYISRADAKYRKITNELEIIQFLEKYEFSVVKLESMSFLDQVRLFRDVEIVVAPHGAGLSNLVFCTKQAKVIEIFSPNYINGCFCNLSQQVELDYYCLIGEGGERPKSYELYRVTDNIKVDLNKLRKTFELAEIVL